MPLKLDTIFLEGGQGGGIEAVDNSDYITDFPGGSKVCFEPGSSVTKGSGTDRLSRCRPIPPARIQLPSVRPLNP